MKPAFDITIYEKLFNRHSVNSSYIKNYTYKQSHQGIDIRILHMTLTNENLSILHMIFVSIVYA